MLAAGAANMKPFRLNIYVPNYVGDSIVNYIQISLNNCTGNAPGMNLGKEFYAPEFDIKAREATKAGLPVKSMKYVAELPAVLRTITFDLKDGTGTADALRIETGKKITPKPTDPTPPVGKTFKGWKVLGESTIWDFDTMTVPDRDITLVAQYA